MIQQIKLIVARAAAAATVLFLSAPAMAVDCTDPTTGTIAQGAACAKPAGAKDNLFGDGGIFSTITTTLIFLVGAISVIYLIIGGLRYVVSGGDATAVKGAKDTILYAIIGIVVSILAYAAVQFVISRVAGTP